MEILANPGLKPYPEGMKMNFPAALGAVFAAFVSLASGQISAVRDDRGREFRVDAPPRRIVSLAPNITEILFTLGAGGQVAGVTRYCDYPPEAATRAKIGGFLDPDIERIRDLAPDLVIAFRGNPLERLDRLEKLGLRVFVLDIGERLSEIPGLVGKIGAVVGRSGEAEALIRTMREKETLISSALASLAVRPRVFLKLQGEGLWTCGRESYFTDLIEKAGGTSVTSGVPKNWLEYGVENLVRDAPDLIVVLARSDLDFAQTRTWLNNRPGARETAAVRTGRILRLDENAASRYGPRLFDALEELARLLHPEKF
jgi:iron complex transport system substrate-binding protein